MRGGGGGASCRMTNHYISKESKGLPTRKDYIKDGLLETEGVS